MHDNTTVCLLCHGIPGDRRVNAGNVLRRAALAKPPPSDGSRVIYGRPNRLGLIRLKREGTTFKQVSYQTKMG